jgi:exosortase A-associated hydrolase 2
MAPEAFFLPVADGQRFCLYHPPMGLPRGAFLYLHPFAEEMNKSRRMAALQSRQLAAHGYAVLQVDLHGCGDSSGDFGDATWQSWLQDLGMARDWLRTRCEAPLWLWGLRAGCLLAADAAARGDESVGFLFWQPAVSGRQHLQQFLRLKAAGNMLGGDPRGAMAAVRRQLDESQSPEIAGYTLNPDLARGLEAAQLEPPNRPGRVVWLELSTRDDAHLSPAAATHVEQWRAAEHEVAASVVTGPAFWQTAEIEEAPALLTATLAALNTMAR